MDAASGPQPIVAEHGGGNLGSKCMNLIIPTQIILIARDPAFLVEGPRHISTLS